MEVPIKLSVLMACLKNRPWKRVKSRMESLMKGRNDVEFLYELDNGERTSGQKRQILMERALGEYVCFVDDDDDVYQSYIDRIFEGIEKGVDVVSFDLKMTGGKKGKEIWKFGMYANDRRQGNMCVNHLCVWRRSLASKVAWCPDLGYQDDSVWFLPLFHSGLIESHYHIDEVLYLYKYSSIGTVNQRREKLRYSNNEYLKNGIRCFFDKQRKIVLEVPEIAKSYLQHNSHEVCVRDRTNKVFVKNLSELDQYFWISK